MKNSRNTKRNHKEKTQKITKRAIRKRNNIGITLVSLVVTIIVLIILAGVSINLVLDEDGIFTMALRAREETQTATEEERLKMQLLTIQMGENNQEIGTMLYDKTVENGSKWHLIIENESSKKYGTNWTYIKKGTNLEGNVTSQYSYVVNVKTGEIKKLEEGTYTELSYADNIGVPDKEHLILNLDSSVIDGAEGTSIEALQSQLGENVKLNGFDAIGTSESGLTTTSFNLDGENDYIQIQYDGQNEKKTLAENGLTFEFYGVITGGSSYTEKEDGTRNKLQLSLSKYPMLSYWNGNILNFPNFRCWAENNKRFVWSINIWKGQSDFQASNGEDKHIICYDDIFNLNEKIYITLTLDCSKVYREDTAGKYYKQTLYINGEKQLEGGYNKLSWDAFVKTMLPTLKYFNIGRTSSGEVGTWNYSKMNAYSIRLYSRALTEEEVTLNYNKSVQYHDLLVSE